MMIAPGEGDLANDNDELLLLSVLLITFLERRLCPSTTFLLQCMKWHLESPSGLSFQMTKSVLSAKVL